MIDGAAVIVLDEQKPPEKGGFSAQKYVSFTKWT